MLDITTNGNAAITASRLVYGRNHDGNFHDGCLAACKVYGAVLTAAEIEQEMRCYLPMRTANLNSWFPLLSASDQLVDYSGVSGNLVLTGVVAAEDGPPIPWSVGSRRRWYALGAPSVLKLKTSSGTLFALTGGGALQKT